jgi:O-antigen/teichoic acid export membrane protein
MIVSIFIFIKGPDDLLTYIIIIITFNLISLFSIIPLIFKYTFFLVPKIETIKYHFFQNTYLFLPILTTIFISQFSKILLDLYSLRSEVGFYQIAENISLLPTFFNTAIVTVMFPYSSKLVYGNNPERNHEVLQISIKFSSIINIGIVFGLISLSKEFIPWYLGENYQRTAVIIQYLAPFIIISGIVNIIIYQYLLPHSMDKLYTTIFLFAAFLNLILNYLFIPIYQGIGVAISLNFTYLIILILFIFIPSKNSINKSLFLNLVPFLFSGILMYFSINLLKFLNFSALLNLIIKGLFGLLIYTFLSSFFLIWQKDFVFKQIINKFIGRKI